MGTGNNVTIRSTDIEKSSEIRPALEKFAEKLGARVEVANPHGEQQRPCHNDDFDYGVYFWSLPRSFNKTKFNTAYGHTLVNGQKDGCALDETNSQLGVKIFDPDGITVALIAEKTLYVLFDLPHSPSTEPGLLMELILDDYYLFLTDPVAFVKVMKKRLSKKRTARDKFVWLYQQLLKGQNTQRELVDLEERINSHRQETAVLARDRKILIEKRKTNLEMSDRDRKKKIGEMFSRLRDLSANKRITVVDQLLTVPLGQIDIEYEGDVYDIGKMDLEINLQNCTLRCFNRTRPGGRQHPHVSGSGDCCLGDASYGIGVLLGDLELEMVVVIMIEFLKSYYPAGAYQSVEYWPKRSK